MALPVSTVKRIDPRLITIEDGWNFRVDTPEFLQGIEDLAASIASEGVLVPVSVFEDGDKIVLDDGHRRLRAALRAIELGTNIETIPYLTVPKKTNRTERLLGMVNRNTGTPNTPLELAEAFRRLIAYGLDQKQIALRTGRTEGGVSQIMAINALAPAVKNMVVKGDVAASTAVQATRKHKGKAADVLSDAIAKANAKAAEKAAKAAEKAAKPGKEPAKPAAVSSRAKVKASDVMPALPKDSDKRLKKIQAMFLELTEQEALDFCTWLESLGGEQQAA